MKLCKYQKHPAAFIALVVFILAPSASAESATALYNRARDYYKSLISNSSKAKLRHNWDRAINYFEDAAAADASSNTGARAQFMVGQCYEKLFGYSMLADDAADAVEAYDLLAEAFGESTLADDGLYSAGRILETTLKKPEKAWTQYKRIIDDFPDGDMAEKARGRLSALAKYAPKSSGKVAEKEADEDYYGTVKAVAADAPKSAPTPKSADSVAEEEPTGLKTVSEIRHWSNPDYTRIVITTDEQIEYKAHMLRADPAQGKPPRLYIDIEQATLDAEKVPSIVPINDGLLKRVRIARYTKSTVRVVLDIESIKRYRIFALPDPDRMVIDVVGINAPDNVAGSGKSGAAGKQSAKQPGGKVTLAAQLGLEVKKIVIDAGHGGKDPGAIGRRGTKEKKIVLDIALKTANRLRDKGYEVILTRSDDTFLPLEERTAIANTNRADLFISIHANAARNRKARGIESYYLSLAKDEDSVRVAARENATSSKKISDLQLILQDLMTTSKVNESSLLAGYVQEALIGGLSEYYSDIHDHGVKHAPFFVLIGAEMPCLLIETGFISNYAEEKRLLSNDYRIKVAEQIVRGVERYAKQIKISSY